jgi:CDP-2,3-bis-(O-geranylgeranyl)-sn-glycerol synthase
MLMSDITQDLAFALWFMLPAAAANTAPIVAAALPGIKTHSMPIDGGRTFRGKPIFGLHKTWRGLLAGIIVGTLVFWLQEIAYQHHDRIIELIGTRDYLTLPALLCGPLFGIGAIGGDAIESFFKRQRGITSGGTWVPFDQLDYILGTLIVTAPIVALSLREYILTLVLWFIIHLLASYVGWRMGLKDVPI